MIKENSLNGILRSAAIIFILTLSFLSIGYTQSSIEKADSQKYLVNVSVDPIGFLALGPSVETELVPARFFGITTGLRLPYYGQMTKSLYQNMTGAWTVQGSMKFYFNRSNYARGFYLGPSMEYGKTYYEYDDPNDNRTFQVLGVGARLGYKWIINSWFTIDLSDMIGGVLSRREGSVDSSWNMTLFVYYLISLKAGVAF